MVKECDVYYVQVAVGGVYASTSSSDAKAYWNMKFPNIPMPAVLELMLPNPSGIYR